SRSGGRLPVPSARPGSWDRRTPTNGRARALISHRSVPKVEVDPMIASDRRRIMSALRQDGPRAPGWIALGVAWASVAISGCTPQAGAERVATPPTVGVVEARRMTVPIMAEPIGTTRALQEVSIRARVRGFLKEIHFKEGGDVKAGQLLFVIDEEPFQAKLAEGKAALKQADA